MRKTLCLILFAAVLAAGTAGAFAEPLKLAEDLSAEIRVTLNDRAEYVYAYRYPQADPSDPSAELINSFYQYLAKDAEDFEIPMNADYFRSQDIGEDVTVDIGYEVTCNSDEFFGVLIHTKQTGTESYAGHTFSRKDLKPGLSVALPYLLGLLKSEETDTWLQDRQTAKANAFVRSMIMERLRDSDDVELCEDFDEETLEFFFFPEEDFYLDETGNPVFYLQPGMAEDSDRLLRFPITIEEILDEM